ncbi:MAG: hypothetical protein ABI435_10380 [Pseudolysinimonas sp.]
MSEAPPPPSVPSQFAPGYAAFAVPLPRNSAPMMSIIAASLGGLLVLLYLLVKVTAAALQADSTAYAPGSSSYTIATVLGFLGLLAIIPAAVVVVVAHQGARRRPDGSDRGRLLAAAALSVGYLLVLMWGNRLLATLVIASTSNDFTMFVQNNFWWA